MKVSGIRKKTQLINSWIPEGYFAKAQYQGTFGAFDGWDIYQKTGSGRNSKRLSCFVWVRSKGFSMMAQVGDVRPDDLSVMKLLEEKIPLEFGIPMQTGFASGFEKGIRDGIYILNDNVYETVPIKSFHEFLQEQTIPGYRIVPQESDRDLIHVLDDQNKLVAAINAFFLTVYDERVTKTMQTLIREYEELTKGYDSIDLVFDL